MPPNGRPQPLAKRSEASRLERSIGRRDVVRRMHTISGRPSKRYIHQKVVLDIFYRFLLVEDRHVIATLDLSEC